MQMESLIKLYCDKWDILVINQNWHNLIGPTKIMAQVNMDFRLLLNAVYLLAKCD